MPNQGHVEGISLTPHSFIVFVWVVTWEGLKIRAKPHATLSMLHYVDLHTNSFELITHSCYYSTHGTSHFIPLCRGFPFVEVQNVIMSVANWSKVLMKALKC